MSNKVRNLIFLVELLSMNDWYKTAMHIELGKDGVDNSWQDDFPEDTECCRCGGNARLGFVSKEDDEKEYVCDLYENGEDDKFWLHDSCAVAIYFCEECLEPTSLYNQG